MRYLEDKNTGLVIVSPEVDIDENGDFYSPDEQTFQDLYKELDSWNAKNILTYVSDGKPLGNYLKGFRDPRRTHYFVFEDGVLTGTALVEKKGLLTQYITLKGYVSYCENHNKPKGVEGCLSVENALRVMQKPTNQCIINLLAVKNEAQGKGIGTRIIKTISDNLGHFTEEESSNVLNAFIYEDNCASIKAFENNGFRRPFRWYDDQIYAGFDTYYKVIDKKEDEDVNTK